MSSIGLVISGNSNESDSLSTNFAGLIYIPSENLPYSAGFSMLTLTQNGLIWTDQQDLPTYQPAQLTLIDQNRQPIYLPLIINNPITLYLGIQNYNCPQNYLPLKINQRNFQFEDTAIDDLTVRIEILGGKNLRWNDIRTRSLLKVGEEYLVDLINGPKFQCLKIFLSPYRNSSVLPNCCNNSNILNPFLNDIMVGSNCVPNCLGKSCSDDNGCGSQCGCINGQICNPATGICQNSIPGPVCNLYNLCGQGAGKCIGFCINGKICQRNIDGFAQCITSPISVGAIILTIISILSLLFLVVVIIMSINELFKASSNIQRSTNEVATVVSEVNICNLTIGSEKKQNLETIKMSQTGLFYLIRASETGPQLLSFISDGQVKFLDQPNSIRPVALNFIDLSGYSAKYLTTGRIYFLAAGPEYITVTSQPDTFNLSTNPSLSGRLFIYLPVGNVYTTNCNFNGFFFIHGPDIKTSGLANFNTLALDMLWLFPVINNGDNIIAKDCVPNCLGKIWTDDNGCGLPCGCNNGTCSSFSQCINVPDKKTPICVNYNQNQPVQCDGPCFGICPNGFQCVRNNNDDYYCIQTNASKYGVINMLFIIALIIIVLLSAIAIVLWLQNKNNLFQTNLNPSPTPSPNQRTQT